jgi:hypothetical protein
MRCRDMHRHFNVVIKRLVLPGFSQITEPHAYAGISKSLATFLLNGGQEFPLLKRGKGGFIKDVIRKDGFSKHDAVFTNMVTKSFDA